MRNNFVDTIANQKCDASTGKQPGKIRKRSHRTQKGITAVAVTAAVAITACGIAASCTPAGQSPDTEKTNVAESALVNPLPTQAARHSPEEYIDVFPDQVNSFLSGTTEAEPENDNYVHSHATLAEHVEPMLNLDANPQESMGCTACKSTDFNALYAEEGKAAFAEEGSEYIGQGKYWDCNICHEDEPGSTLRPGLVLYQLYGSKTMLPNISVEEALCGQCHNALGQYGRSRAANFEGDLADIDPYRYGLDPDGLKKAALEDGLPTNDDSDTGTSTYTAQHPDIEIFQGSVHERLGLTCVDCHMPKKTNENGNQYTSHDASSTPLENDEALEFCLTCHKDQGVDDIEEMRQFILDAESDLADKESQVQEKLATLKELLTDATSNGGIDDASLEQAREAYSTATWYYTYAHGSAERPGQKAAHNPSGEREYQDKAIAMLDEAIALFDAQ